MNRFIGISALLSEQKLTGPYKDRTISALSQIISPILAIPGLLAALTHTAIKIEPRMPVTGATIYADIEV